MADRPGIFIPGELYGVFSHKVSLGTYAAIALLVLLFAPEDFPGPLTRWGAILICTVGLLLSNSASSIVALAVASALLAATRRFPGWRAALFGATILVVVAVSIALPFVDASSVAQAFGRPPTLTGRTSFWSRAPDYIMERPFFGYGYAGFFDTDPYSRVWDLWAAAEWFFTPNFHNSALDVTIALGFVGLAAYLAVLLTASRVHGNRSLGRSAGLLAAVIVLVAVGSATDFQLMRHNALPTVLLFYAFLAGGRRYAMTSSARDGR
jgi:exopolysaccharide production protein ExoQ